MGMMESVTDTESLDLDAYLARIGYDGSRDATVDTLDEIVKLHSRVIPFENLTSFLGSPVDIDLESIQQKLVSSKRGGYCFEQNLLLRAVLTELGYNVTPLTARVLWGNQQDAETAVTMRSHMLLAVEVDGEPRLADVGFGGSTLTSSIRMTLSQIQETNHENARLTALDGDYALQISIGDKWRYVYRFDLQRQYPVDYIAPNWYISTSPDSKFVQGLMAARTDEGKRYALNGRNFAVHHLGAESEQRTLETPTELIECLQQDFHIELDEWSPLEQAFDRLG